ncbi:MAG: hypothetical protein IPP11_12310 [Chitinophagaceae bacterium]|nr:hypothetical protein [Chitinophagaceae bacterium]
MWKSFKKYDNHYKYSTWIYRIALNISISFYRKTGHCKRLLFLWKKIYSPFKR